MEQALNGLLIDRANYCTFTDFLDDVYRAFQIEYLQNRPPFRNLEMRMKKRPYTEGRECTFYHMAYKGEWEERRYPCELRCARIKWPAHFINNDGHPDLKIWEKIIKGKRRVHILHEQLKYVVVLELRENYYLLWTAYIVEQNHTMRKLLKDYERYGL